MPLEPATENDVHVDRESVAAVIACMCLLIRKHQPDGETFVEKANGLRRTLKLAPEVQLDFSASCFTDISLEKSPALVALNSEAIVRETEFKGPNWSEIRALAISLNRATAGVEAAPLLDLWCQESTTAGDAVSSHPLTTP